MAVIAKLAVLSVVVGVTVVLFVGPACGCTTKDHAYRSAVKSDLRYLASAQEVLYSDSLRYGALSELDFTASTGVTVEVTFASDSAWSATAGHVGILDQCTVFYGPMAPPVPDAVAGELICHDPS
jgi:hypothetical protein